VFIETVGRSEMRMWEEYEVRMYVGGYVSEWVSLASCFWSLLPFLMTSPLLVPRHRFLHRRNGRIPIIPTIILFFSVLLVFPCRSSSSRSKNLQRAAPSSFSRYTPVNQCRLYFEDIYLIALGRLFYILHVSSVQTPPSTPVLLPFAQ
jgi:hypothetical protein